MLANIVRKFSTHILKKVVLEKGKIMGITDNPVKCCGMF